jgi:Spy/CpxP family protein refolding chaperone
MSINLKRPHILGAFALLLGMGIVGCDSSDSPDGEFASLEVQDLFNAVSSEVDMDSEQRRRFAHSLGQHDRRSREPGFLWIVADSLADALTDEQKEKLLGRTAPMERNDSFRGLSGFPGGGGFYGLGGFKGGSSRHGDSPLDEALGLTDEQSDAIHDLHETFRSDAKALRESLKNDETTREEFLQAVKDLHAALKDALDAVFTDEQKETIAEFRARREADFLAFREEVIAVRNQVLGLTEPESETFNALLQDQLEAREVLHEQFQDGEIDLATLRTEIEALIAFKDETLEALLTEAQYEVVQIHDALAVRMGRRGHRGGPPPPRG